MGQDRLSLFVGNQEMLFAGAGGHSGMIVGLYFPFGKLIFEIVNTEVMKKSGPGSCLGIPSELSGNEPGDIRNVQTVHEAGCLKMLLIPLKLFVSEREILVGIEDSEYQKEKKITDEDYLNTYSFLFTGKYQEDMAEISHTDPQ